jgi:hypothetical protein
VIDTAKCPDCDEDLTTPPPIEEEKPRRSLVLPILFALIMILLMLLVLCFAFHIHNIEKDTVVRNHPYLAIVMTNEGIYQCLNQTHCTMIESIRYNATINCQFNRLGKTQHSLSIYPKKNEFFYYWPLEGVSPIELATVFLAQQ